MSDLIVHRNIKVKNNKTNISLPIDKYIINTFRWDLRSSNVIIDVDYYVDDNFQFTNEFVFIEKEEVDVNKLIEQVKNFH
jgi:hypothetical protein